MTVVIMKQSRSEEVPMLRSALQRRTLPILSTCFLKLSNILCGYPGQLWFHSQNIIHTQE